MTSTNDYIETVLIKLTNANSKRKGYRLQRNEKLFYSCHFLPSPANMIAHSAFFSVENDYIYYHLVGLNNKNVLLLSIVLFCVYYLIFLSLFFD